MQVVERHIIKKSHKSWRELDDLAFKSKNLYNLVNYHFRQYYFSNQQFLTAYTLYHQVKDTEAYRALPTKVSKQVLLRVEKAWKSYREALKAYEKSPEKFQAKPRIPRYKDKTKGRNVVIYPKDAIYKKALKRGYCHLSMSNISVPTKAVAIAEARIIPSTNCYVLEIVYERLENEPSSSQWIAGIDLGVDNLVALTSNQPGFRPLLVNGRPLKSRNQHYNKLKAKLQSYLKGNVRERVSGGILPPEISRTSRRIQSLTYHRNRYVDNYLHNTSSLVVNLLKQQDIGTLVIGKNDGWKQRVNIGKRNNQNFTQIPHAKLIEQLTYKCELAGIKVIEVNESYTSKTSALDFETPCKQATYLGKRVHRGLFRSATNRVINADINGSLQIVRKYSPEAFPVEAILSCAVQPILVNPV